MQIIDLIGRGHQVSWEDIQGCEYKYESSWNCNSKINLTRIPTQPYYVVSKPGNTIISSVFFRITKESSIQIYCMGSFLEHIQQVKSERPHQSYHIEPRIKSIESEFKWMCLQREEETEQYRKTENTEEVNKGPYVCSSTMT